MQDSNAYVRVLLLKLCKEIHVRQSLFLLSQGLILHDVAEILRHIQRKLKYVVYHRSVPRRAFIRGIVPVSTQRVEAPSFA